jgi:hypothetical protein
MIQPGHTSSARGPVLDKEHYILLCFCRPFQVDALIYRENSEYLLCPGGATQRHKRIVNLMDDMIRSEEQETEILLYHFFLMAQLRFTSVHDIRIYDIHYHNEVSCLESTSGVN